MKPEREQAAREVFRDTAINVTIKGHKHLGAVLGSRLFLEECVGEKVDKWVNEVTKLADFAISQPQACYAAFTFGLQHCWTCFLRTELLQNYLSHSRARLMRFSYQLSLTIQSLKQSTTSFVSLCASEALDLEIL